ncbi:lasso peptide biosynthesis B2 protein [Antarctobacter jejuensis]|uniref:lasso peptide biosynthesis B2 protein n=1 Tax=Antarctobacter jejuensis TaxID=1439938 RepID=UPI003FD03902
MSVLRKITLRRLIDVAWAMVLLGRARLRTRRGGLAEAAQSGDQQAPWPPLTDAQRQAIDRTTWAIAVAARFVPWRSDCLVQALAARAMLAAHGVDSRLVIGVPRQMGDRFEAHAWLLSHGVTVTGGQVARYNAFPAS